MRLNLKRIIAFVSILFGLSAAWAVSPCPGKSRNQEPSFPQLTGPATNDRTGRDGLPQSILVLQVAFSDMGFDLIPDYPDSLAHNQAFIERCFFHLHEYLMDNSRGAYDPVFTVTPLITLPNPMAYYGDDTNYNRSVEMISDAIVAADPTTDFSDYDAFVLFHAGSGQESDIDDLQLGELWSTFVNRYDMQYVFDPHNADYPGIATSDGVYVTQVCVLPESEWQPYFTSSSPRLGLLGVMVHEFGHCLGLPTLYDNVDSDGTMSQGVGNFDPMSTGAWNAMGYVPPMLSAWCRVHLGWDTTVEIDRDTQSLTVNSIQSALDGGTRVVKVPVSAKEYFLVENRQENPDNSEETWYKLDGGSVVIDKTQKSFTFDSLATGQDHYPYPNQRIAKFNFMQNSYRHCEWDFYLPGYGGPTADLRDGSGLLIWHVDENVIAEKFTSDFYNNYINSDPNHKGIDLEEADGVQDMDSVYPSDYQTGSPEDSYRSGNNDYFGNSTNPATGSVSTPDASSYYGGIPLEIYGIGPSGPAISLSVRFRWSLDSGYSGINTFPAFLRDVDGDGADELCYPSPEGDLFWWRGSDPLNMADGFPTSIPPACGKIVGLPAWDDENGLLIFPCADTTFVSTVVWKVDGMHVIPMTNWRWAAGPLVNPDPDAGLRIFLPGNGPTGCRIDVLNANETLTEPLSIPNNRIMTNLMLADDLLYFITADSTKVRLWYFDANALDRTGVGVPLQGLTVTDSITAAVAAEFDASQEGPEIAIVLGDGRAFIFRTGGAPLAGFPVTLPSGKPSLPSVADVDHNGILDLVVGGENGYSVVGYNGEILNTPVYTAPEPDTSGIAAGILPLDLDNDGEIDLAGSMSRCRTMVWNESNRLWSGFPVSFSSRSRVLPIATQDSTGMVYLMIPGDYGRITRIAFPQADPAVLDDMPWPVELGDLGRTASYRGPEPENKHHASGLFVSGEVYIYPSPWCLANPEPPTLKLMVSRNARVSIKMFDIAGNLIYQDQRACTAWMDNSARLGVDIGKLSSGMYFIQLKSGSETKILRYAVEK
jgi:M6 family metalloprotease-like protein